MSAPSTRTDCREPPPVDRRASSPRPRTMPPKRRCGRRRSTSSSARRRSRANLAGLHRRARRRAARRSTTCSSSARPASARRRWPRSSPASSGVSFRATSGPVIAKAGDLAAHLTNLEPRDVLFIDEIHRLQPGGRGDPLSGDGGLPARPDHRRGAGGALGADRAAAVHPGRRDHPRRPADDAAARPLRHPAAARVLHGRGARAIVQPRRPGARRRHEPRTARSEIARRSRGTPRVASRLLRRVRDFAAVDGAGRRSTQAVADAALTRLEVDRDGLDAMDRRYLTPHRRELRRRAGRRRDARRGALRAARRHRGRHRALPDPAGLPAAHPARPRAHPARLPPPRPARAEPRPGRPVGLFNGRTRMSEAAWPPTSPAASKATPSSAGAGLLRGHRFLRPRLSRELSALPGTGPDGIPARRRGGAVRAPSRTATGSPSSSGA